MDNIQNNPMLLTQSAPKSYLREMLSLWLQWAPGDRRGSTSIPTNLSKTKSGTKSLKKRDFWSKIGTFLRIL